MSTRFVKIFGNRRATGLARVSWLALALFFGLLIGCGLLPTATAPAMIPVGSGYEVRENKDSAWASIKVLNPLDALNLNTWNGLVLNGMVTTDNTGIAELRNTSLSCSGLYVFSNSGVGVQLGPCTSGASGNWICVVGAATSRSCDVGLASPSANVTLNDAWASLITLDNGALSIVTVLEGTAEVVPVIQLDYQFVEIYNHSFALTFNTRVLDEKQTIRLAAGQFIFTASNNYLASLPPDVAQLARKPLNPDQFQFLIKQLSLLNRYPQLSGYLEDLLSQAVKDGLTFPTTTTITVDTPDSSSPGQSLEVSVTVSGAGTNPTGWVAIAGADTNCTITLSGGSGSCNVVFNTAGVKTLAAVYGGDGNYSASSDTAVHTVSNSPTNATEPASTVTPSPTNTPVITSTNTPIPCNLASFEADVTYPDNTHVAPNQSFVKTWRIKNIGSCSWNSNYLLVFDHQDGMGVTSGYTQPLTTSAVNPGQMVDLTVNLTAPSTPGTYTGYWRLRDPGGVLFGITPAGGTFLVKIIVVAKSSTTTTITADTPDASVPGQSVTVSVSVSGAGVTPTGTVTITGADVNCTITLSGGTGSCNVVFNTIGAKTLTTTYNGNSNYNVSSDTENHVVTKATTPSTTTITADTPDPSVPGQSVTVTVTVSGAGVTPTGTVAITGADSNCTNTLSSGSGSCNVVFNTAGAKTLTATYNGNSNYLPSSNSTSHTVKNATTTTITADIPDASAPNQSVTVTVTVSGAGVTPTGMVAITGADSNCTITLSGGSGSCNVVFNTAGAKTLTATYNGNGYYSTSSDTEDHTVSEPQVMIPPGTVTITGADTNCALTLSVGHS